MDFAVSCLLVRRLRLLSGSCPSTRTFAPCFFQTPPRGGGPCIITRPSPPSGWPEDFHLQAAEHAQHTTKPLARRTLRVSLDSIGRVGCGSQEVSCDPSQTGDAGGTPASQLCRVHDRVLHPQRRAVRPVLQALARPAESRPISARTRRICCESGSWRRGRCGSTSARSASSS